MTVTIELPEAEARLLADKAALAGKTLGGYLGQIAVWEANRGESLGENRGESLGENRGESLGENGAAPPDRAGPAEAIRRAHSPDDRAAYLMQWLGSHDRQAPALPAAAVSREAMYGGDDPDEPDEARA